MAIFDLPEAVAAIRTSICAAGGSLAAVTRLQVSAATATIRQQAGTSARLRYIQAPAYVQPCSGDAGWCIHAVGVLDCRSHRVQAAMC